MKKSTKALLGLAGAAAGAAGLTLAVGEALYRCSLTFEGLTFVQSKRENNPARMDDLKPSIRERRLDLQGDPLGGQALLAR